jgi:hypothetical protein
MVQLAAMPISCSIIAVYGAPSVFLFWLVDLYYQKQFEVSDTSSVIFL